MSRKRGFTLTETLVSVVVLFLFLGIAYFALLPVIEYMGATQAKADTQGNAVSLLFRLEHDMHESDARAVFYDSGGAQPLPTGSVVDVTVFAVATAHSGTNGDACYAPDEGAFQVDGNGAPLWQGFEVFILSNQILDCVFESESMTACPTELPCQSAASAAITSAKAVTKPPFYGIGVTDIQIGAATGGLTSPIIQFVDLQIKAFSTVDGRTNVTSYTDQLQTRN